MRAIGWAIASSFLFALMNASAKGLSAHLPVPDVVFYRGLIGVVWTLVTVRLYRLELKVRNWPLLVSRGLFGAASLLFAFHTISRIALADASFIAHMAPVFTVILGGIVLKERMPKGFGWVFLVALVGALLIAKPWESSLRLSFVGLGVVAAMLSASASIAIRQLSKDHNNATIMLAFLVTATVLPMPFMDWSNLQIPTDHHNLGLLVLLGTTSFVAQYCMTQAYRQERAGVVSTARYSGLIFNTLLGFLFWNEWPDFISLVGGGLILVGSVGLGVLISREKKTSQ